MVKTGEKESVYILKFMFFVFLFLVAYLTALWMGSSLFTSALPTTAAFLPVTSTVSEPPPVVVLDAGHGGVDSGCFFGSVEEKNLNLEITRLVCEYLKLYDVRVVMTRNEDISLHQGEKYHKSSDVKTRVEIASKEEDPLFVSIHMNSFPVEKYRGFMVYYSRNHKRSEALALQIQTAVKDFVPDTVLREAKAAGSNIYVLDRLQCQAVLIECGFLSNGADRALLTDEAYQKKLAFTIARAVALQAHAG